MDECKPLPEVQPVMQTVLPTMLGRDSAKAAKCLEAIAAGAAAAGAALEEDTPMPAARFVRVSPVWRRCCVCGNDGGWIYGTGRREGCRVICMTVRDGSGGEP